VLATEPALITIELSAQTIRRIVAIDLWYGIVAGAAVISGVMRVIWGAKGAKRSGSRQPRRRHSLETALYLEHKPNISFVSLASTEFTAGFS
jgi:hypothetical protein